MFHLGHRYLLKSFIFFSQDLDSVRARAVGQKARLRWDNLRKQFPAKEADSGEGWMKGGRPIAAVR